ncbi:energy transducer TonB [Nostoc sp. FACHB-280]|uniref:energy transducer TonB n=1 Tax=Nostoc sp. FACHB-280 TaxID=2692839 RepID=UPI00168BFA33|nr:energy transducer TonB [Nostoc sp. FACHB-280]MBD2494828.1 energy transducer TonB [Nostoc sp. FACHB-280]
MSFSSIAIEQRSKEAQALKFVLGYSLVGSLALHVALLGSGIGNFLTRLPADDNEPIELAIVEAPATPEPEIEKAPIEEKKEPPDQVVSQSETQIPERSPVIPQQQSVAIAPVQKFVEKPQVQPVQQPKQPVSSDKPSATTARTTQTSTSTSTTSESSSTDNGGSSGSSGGTGILTGSGSGIGVGVGSGSGTGTGIGNGTGTGTGTGTGSGNGTGTGTGNGTGTGTSNPNPVAVAPSQPKIEAPAPASTNRSSGNGRAACRQCDNKYPEQARRRGIEGKVEVAVDTDANGNVTNVRLTRSSGNRELDEAHLRQARDWKLKPSESGRQGVSISTDYAIRGSRRYREAQERKRQRQARETEQRNQATATANQSTTSETTRRRRSLTSGTIVDVPPERRPIREAATTSESTPLRRRLRPRTETAAPASRPSQATTSSGENNAPRVRRRRRPDSATTSDSASKLRNALRRSRPSSESAPAAAPGESKQ